MEKTIYICDKCGAEFTSPNSLDTIYIPYNWQPYGLIKEKMELCDKCQMKWAQFGEQFLAEREA